MKIYTGLLMIVALCSGLPAFTQFVLTRSLSGKTNAMLSVPEPKIVTASSKIKMAGLKSPLKKPFVVSLDPQAQLTKAKDNCPFLQAKNPTLYLDGERVKNDLVDLQWKTTNGINNLGFDVERSFDDTFHFERVNYVWAKNIAGIADKYQLPDGNDHNKISYYRLRLTLRTGEYSYSNIAKVNGYNKDALLVYPNPASEVVMLNIAANLNGTAAIKIFDATGRIVWQQSSSMNEGQNLKSIPLTNLSSGAYTVLIDMLDNTSRTGKFMKQ